jgi:hypothetical protein
MPHASLKIIPGVDQNKTLALNEAAISESSFIRSLADPNGGGLIQKLGGWSKYYSGSIGSIVRALWAWKDTIENARLAVGAEESLNIILNGGLEDITPQTTEDDVVVSFSTTNGSSIVTIDAVGSGLDAFDAVHIRTQVSVGGLILYGLYPVIPVTTDQFQIEAVDQFGNPQYATATVAAGGAVPEFDTTSGSAAVTVTLADHGLSVGSTFPVLVSTAVGGIDIYGNYIVNSVASADEFEFIARNEATSTANGFENGGDANFIYYNGLGPSASNLGFGVGGFGVGGFGSGVVPASSGGTPITAEDWTLDNFGEDLIACPLDGPIYKWSPTEGNPIAVVIPEGPTINHGALVAMPQRQIIAWGSTDNGIQDPLLVRWCDVNNYHVWAGQNTNQAGKWRISKGSKIVACLQGPQQILLWTDLALWNMQYVGPPFVYSFNEIGTGCGLIGRKAAAAFGSGIYWLGQTQFFRLSGNGVEVMPCPIWDVIFQTLDRDNVDKIRAAPNSRFGEITWYYPTTDSNGEVSNYVKYNAITDKWDYGVLARTAWINESVLGAPIGASSNYYIYQHEVSPDADGQAMFASFRTGYFALTEGDQMMFVDEIWPDMKWGDYNGSQNAVVNITFYVANYPTDEPQVFGPYEMTSSTKYLTPRFRGRLVSVEISSNDVGSFWRLGNIRYRVQPDGRY